MLGRGCGSEELQAHCLGNLLGGIEDVIRGLIAKVLAGAELLVPTSVLSYLSSRHSGWLGS